MRGNQRFDGMPWGFVGMFVLILAVERFLSAHNLDLTTATASDWRQTAYNVARRASKAEILCFGDSMVKFGVLPRILQARSGLPAYNLALYSGSPQMSYFLLNRVLKAGAKPSVLIVDFQPEQMMADHIQVHARDWPGALDFSEIVDLAKEAKQPEFALGATLARVFPSIGDRLEIREEIRAQFNGQTKSPRSNILAYQRNWLANFGSQVLPDNPSYDGSVPVEYALFFDHWECKTLNAAYVRKFLKLAENRGIPVLWVIPPNVREVQRRRLQIGLTEKYDRFVSSALEKYKNLRILDARELGLSHEYFVDAVHLDRQGAIELSNLVADHVGSNLRESSEARWVALKPSPRRHETIPLEDVYGSIEILRKLKVLR